MATFTTTNGSPVDNNDHSISAGVDGPLLLQDFTLIDKLAHFDRERIPERVVHAKGAGAHGYFETTNDVSKYTRAKFLNQVGKKTPVFARFSTVGGEKGSADAERDPRGFAIKFYTEEGNYDLVGNNTPVFFIRDPLKFPDLIHTQKRNPQTNLKDHNMIWDFFSLTPESTHQVTILYSDRGNPRNYRQMNGYSSHTFKWVNSSGTAFWVKYHFKTESGIQCLPDDESKEIRGTDPDHATRDLFEHIAKGNEATWKAYVQIMPYEDATKYKFNPFDVTKVWSHKDYPLIPIGRLVLNRNPENYFAEVEQAAFSPSHLVPGIEPSPDKLLQGRLFSYPDTHRHRLGVNFHQIPINAPIGVKGGVHNGMRDGAMQVHGNQGNAPNYYPNTVSGSAVTRPDAKWHSDDAKGTFSRWTYQPRSADEDFVQAGDLYRIMSEDQKSKLVASIAGSLGQARKDIQERQVAHFYKADHDYGTRVAKAIGLDPAKVFA